MKKYMPHVAAVSLMVIWGLSYLSIKFVVNEIDPILSAFYRFAISSAIMGLFLLKKRTKVHKADRIRFMLGGLFGVASYFTFQNIGVSLTTTGNVAIILSTIPIFTLVVNSVMMKKKLSMEKLVGIMLSIVGIAFIILSKDRVALFSSGTLGDILVFGSAISWVIYTLILSHLHGQYTPMEASFYSNIWGVLFLSPILLFTGFQPLSSTGTFHLLYLAVVCTFIGYNLYIYSLKALGEVRITTYINLQPVVSLTASIFILKEATYPMQILGAAIIIAGVFLVNKKERNKI